MLQRDPALRLFQLFEQDPDGPLRSAKRDDKLLVSGLQLFKPSATGEDRPVHWAGAAYSFANSKLSTQVVDSSVALAMTPEQQAALLWAAEQARQMEEQLAGLQHAESFARAMRFKDRVRTATLETAEERPGLFASLFAGWTTRTNPALAFNTGPITESSMFLLSFDPPPAPRASLAATLPPGRAMAETLSRSQALPAPQLRLEHGGRDAMVVF
jgi:hypothetical protein